MSVDVIEQLSIEERLALIERLQRTLPAPEPEPEPEPEPFFDPRNEHVEKIVDRLDVLAQRVEQARRLGQNVLAATTPEDREIEHVALMAAYAAIWTELECVKAHTGKDHAEISAWYFKQAQIRGQL